MNASRICLYEILVPCEYEDTKTYVSTKHHREFDKFVLRITNGITILKPTKGVWINEGITYEDRVIPVRIACSEEAILKIAKFALTHYRQISVMYYELSNNVQFVTKAE